MLVVESAQKQEVRQGMYQGKCLARNVTRTDDVEEGAHHGKVLCSVVCKRSGIQFYEKLSISWLQEVVVKW
jgi:cytochrome b subunit of formate dehydrogenase